MVSLCEVSVCDERCRMEEGGRMGGLHRGFLVGIFFDVCG